MKVWVILEHLGSYEDSYTCVARVYDSEDKANDFVNEQKQKRNSLELELAYCRSCTLCEDIDDFIFTCHDNKQEPDQAIIKRMAEKYKKKHKCPCKISPYLDDDYECGVVCDHHLYLSHTVDEFGYYTITPMEVQ